MRKSVKIRLTVAISVILLLAVAVCSFLVFSSSAEDGNIYEGTLTNTFDKTELVERLLSTSQHDEGKAVGRYALCLYRGGIRKQTGLGYG